MDVFRGSGSLRDQPTKCSSPKFSTTFQHAVKGVNIDEKYWTFSLHQKRSVKCATLGYLRSGNCPGPRWKSLRRSRRSTLVGWGEDTPRRFSPLDGVASPLVLCVRRLVSSVHAIQIADHCCCAVSVVQLLMVSRRECLATGADRAKAAWSVPSGRSSAHQPPCATIASACLRQPTMLQRIISGAGGDGYISPHRKHFR